MDPEKKSVFGKNLFKKINFENIFIGVALLLGFIAVINLIMTISLNNEIRKNIEMSKEKAKPAKIGLIIIKNSKCADCFDTSTVASYLKTQNTEITGQTIFEFDSSEGKELIAKYKIEKVPTLIVTGEIEKLSIQGLEKKEDVLLLAMPTPPYTDAATGRIEGRVTLYNLKDKSCEKCSDLTPLVNQIKVAGVNIYSEKIVEPNSDEGKQLIEKYKIDFVPALILSEDAGLYSLIQQAWPQVGSKESDGSYVLRLVNPPFMNLTSDKLRGLVNVIYLTDNSCTECYDVNQHRQILTNPQSFAVTLDKEESIDISDARGKELIARYNISKVPTVIISDEINVYPSRVVLRQFFSAENDGSYVFRSVQILGTYKDLAANQIVKAQQQTPQQTRQQI
ncbi:MAG: hypothetical protein AABX33_00910 [Nanoarchaeota archaeon]